LAAEAQHAEAQGKTIGQASADPDNFQLLHVLHNGVQDFLTLEIPSELVPWARRVLRMPEPPIASEIQSLLGRLAIDPEAPPTQRSLARVLLYQGTRLQILLEEHLSGRSIAAVGAKPSDIDEIVDLQVSKWIEHAHEFADEVHPFEVLAAAARGWLDRHVEALRSFVGRMDADMAELFRMRGQLELRLREMSAPDAVLFWNSCADVFEEQYLNVERLQKRHRLLFEGMKRPALDQRVHRLNERVGRTHEFPKRRGVALIDLLAEQLQEVSS